MTADHVDQQTAPDATHKRNAPPKKVLTLLFVLFGAVFVISQVISTSGPEINWIEGDLDAARKQAKESGNPLFVYAFEPDDPIAKRNDRMVFTQRWARERLANMICCRIPLEPRDAQRGRLGYRDEPVMILFRSDGEEISRISGAVDRKQFRTYIWNE